MTSADRLVRISAEELAGDLPAICARTGRPDTMLRPVWFARSAWWAWVPLAGLLGWALLRTSWSPLASWWILPAILLPLVLSRGVVGRVPLSAELNGRLSALRRRRLVVVLSALLLTWVAVALWLIGSRLAGLLVLAAVVVLYVGAVGMFAAGRLLSVGGWPEPDGGATLTRVHPDFVAAVELRRTGHRP